MYFSFEWVDNLKIDLNRSTIYHIHHIMEYLADKILWILIS